MKLFNRKLQAEALMTHAIERLNHSDWVIDCGANVGSVSKRCASKGAHVLAFEPDAEIFQILETELASYPNASAQQKAVGTKNGQVKLFHSPYYEEDKVSESVKNTILVEADTHRQGGGRTSMNHSSFQTVECMDLLEILEQKIGQGERIAILKMDIEGAELEILEEMERRNLFKNIKFTIAELHGFRLPSLQDRFESLRKRIRRKYWRSHVNLDWG